jgi:prophage DNA circulation protein
MSWTDAIQQRVQITTGGGQVFEPLTMITSFTSSFDFNISEFEFPEIEGTKVDRRLRKGVRYPMELFFQGDDAIEQGKAFVEASRDTRPWTVLHPIFGQFKGQPISIEMDSTGLNIFKITTTVVETILEDGAKTVFEPSENVKYILEKSKELNSSSFEASITSFNTTDVTLMQDNVNDMYNKASSTITDQTVFDEYLNLFNTAQTKINSALNSVLFGIGFVQSFINYPANFAVNVKTRLNTVLAQIELFIGMFDANSSFNEKKILENNYSALITTLIETISTPQENDYQSATDVIYIIDQSILTYNTFIEQLQLLQSDNGYELDSYLPNAELLESLSYSFNYAISNLFIIALTAQQERIITLEEGSNILIQTHRFYGLDTEDVNLNRFVKTNNIGLNETLQLKKGRKLVYYV